MYAAAIWSHVGQVMPGLASSRCIFVPWPTVSNVHTVLHVGHIIPPVVAADPDPSFAPDDAQPETAAQTSPTRVTAAKCSTRAIEISSFSANRHDALDT